MAKEGKSQQSELKESKREGQKMKPKVIETIKLIITLMGFLGTLISTAVIVTWYIGGQFDDVKRTIVHIEDQVNNVQMQMQELSDVLNEKLNSKMDLMDLEVQSCCPVGTMHKPKP